MLSNSSVDISTAIVDRKQQKNLSHPATHILSRHQTSQCFAFLFHLSYCKQVSFKVCLVCVLLLMVLLFKIAAEHNYDVWCSVPGASQVALVVKNPPACVGDMRDMGLIPGVGRSSGGRNGSPLQCFYLKNPMDRRAWWTSSFRSQRVGHNWRDLTHNTHIIVPKGARRLQHALWRKYMC